MPSNSFILCVPVAMAADLNTALTALGHGENNIGTAAYQSGVHTYTAGHMWDPLTPEAPEGHLSTRWRGMPQPPGGWGQYGLSPSRINQLKQAMLYSVHTHDSGLSTGAQHLTEFCQANGFVWRGMAPPLRLGPVAAGAYRTWNYGQSLVYVLAAHERTTDTDPATEPARYRVL